MSNSESTTKFQTTPKDIVYLKALESTLSEWNSKYDDEDYSDL